MTGWSRRCVLERFLLQIDGHVLAVTIRDDGRDPTVPVLVDTESARIGVLPVAAAPDAPPSPTTRFPWMPRALRDQAESAGTEPTVRQLEVDVSALPPGVFPIRLDEFAAHALLLTDAHVSRVELTLQDAQAWGSIEVAEAGE
jgi:hypothetical protein